jgi:hypothetical protein
VPISGRIGSDYAHGRPRPQAVAASLPIKSAQSCAMSAPARPTKITFAEMRTAGVRGVLIYCSDYHCSHWVAISGDRWADDIRLSDIEPRFTCQACGQRGADVRPDFDWEIEARRAKVSGAADHAIPSP